MTKGEFPGRPANRFTFRCAGSYIARVKKLTQVCRYQRLPGVFFLLLALAAGISGCVPKGTPLPKELKRSVWINPLAAQAPARTYLVLPFESQHAAGDIAPSAEIAVVKRLRERGYNVFGRDEVMASLKNKPLGSLVLSDEEARNLARELGADVVVRGLISDLQVNLEATDVAEGESLWRASEPFMLPIGDHSTVLSREAVVSTMKRLIRAVTDRLPQGVSGTEKSGEAAQPAPSGQ